MNSKLPDDKTIFDQQLKQFMPPGSFDAHAHFYRPQDAIAGLPPSAENPAGFSGWQEYCEKQELWMGTLRPSAGLFFAIPNPKLERQGANQFVLNEIKDQPGSRALLLVTPADDPTEVEAQIKAGPFNGFKVYHVYADRTDTLEAEPQEFIPEWVWELSQQYSLSIMLHMVRARAMADPINQDYIRSHCLQYPEARLILAHAARGFCGNHTTEGIASLRGLDNVFFDTSAICEAQPFEAILHEFGTTRLMFGTDFSVSELKGRCVSIGDGFLWLGEQNVNWETSTFAQPARVGLESLLALKQACHTLRLNDSDVERIFCTNARQLLGIQTATSQNQTQETYKRAKQLIPGGTQLLSKRPEMFAPDCWPGYFREASGCEVIDLDGKKYHDLATSGIGSCLLGYRDPDVTNAVVRRVQLGSMSSLNSPEEVELAALLTELHPWSDQARFCRTGGESMAIAVRIARASTGRDEVALCGYHGWSDWYLATNLPRKSAETGTTLDKHLLPGLEPAGVPMGLSETTHPFTYNDIDGLRQIVKERGSRLAAVVMEPTRYTHPDPGFLEAVREICDECGAVLVIDEITTGWRLTLGGAHLHYGIEPDIAVFAKALGNGHPIAAIIGKRSVMDAAENSFISSTYWTEGVGPTAALATIRKMQSVNVREHIDQIGEAFRAGWSDLGKRHQLPVKVFGHSVLLHHTFDHPQAAELGTLFTIRMLEHGFLTGSGFYPTLAHQTRHVDSYFEAADTVFAELAMALKQDDLSTRLTTPVRHSGFARLTPSPKS
ncbi:aminotransferase class III-fold pyridoxal phosphate-dependent enzyme [Gimesia panareensis]|uniref:aminotransferase class III-fold pyridoxal phosphate-dependent enzyme n=1 Tax=Gimesia panareensis TaxID=2527978 RepID=UPI0011878343|nr:aminotransferase class III-fold pyridoxal phosphate-dependent enzyme [Gimesia panareensis]QDU51967.1 3-aminobutyryl-CoA aminotransferase [Gimesia panareensis]